MDHCVSVTTNGRSASGTDDALGVKQTHVNFLDCLSIMTLGKSKPKYN